MEKHSTFRSKTYGILEGKSQTTHLGLIVNGFIILLILTNFAAVLAETDPETGKRFELEFLLFEYFSVVVFTVELFARLWSIVERQNDEDSASWRIRLNFLFRPLTLVDLFVLVPFYLAFFIPLDMRYMRLIRLLRLLKLTRYFEGMKVFADVLQSETRTIASAIFVVLMLVLMVSCFMYTLEHEVQPDVFGSVYDSIWWAIVTLTTVGYGDVTPITTGGKLMAMLIMLLGIGLVALPAGILAAKFSEELDARKSHLRMELLDALSDGHISDEERTELMKLTSKLGLRNEMLERLISTHKPRDGVAIQCPHCGNPLKFDKG